MNKPHYHFKGTVDTVKELPTENIKEGDCYYVIYPEDIVTMELQLYL